MTKTRFKSYPETKDSGIEWLGQIPEHWGWKRLKRTLTLSRETNGDEPVGEMLSVSGYRGVEEKEYDFEERKRSAEDLAAYRVVRRGQLVVNTMWLNYAGLGVSQVEGHVSPAYRSYWIGSSLAAKYLHHLMRSRTYVERYCSLLYGIRPNSLQIKNHDWDALELLIPPHEEQHAIADFLDRETAKIDGLVEKKERLIELLKEKRTALITHAVTKGLDPNVPMKDSGIEWLGQIPAHWDAVRLKYVGSLVAGSGFPHEYQGVQGEELQFYKVGDLTASSDGVRMQDAPNSISRETAKQLRATELLPGALLWAKIGAALFLNRRRITTRPCCIDNNMTAYVPNSTIVSTDWAFYWTSTLDFGELANPGAVPSLSEGYQATLPLVVPPSEEQQAIADFLDRETAKIDALIAKVREAIERLKEYRTALISAAVTGKIDVRGETA